MRIQKWYGLVLALVLMLGIAGCGLFDNRDPIGPVNPLGDSSQLGNFWVKDGPGGRYEVSTREGEMSVSVPSAGQYMLTYKTMYGFFYIVFEAQDAATLFIGLQPGDSVEMAYIQDGDIVDVANLTIIVQTDILTAYLLPGVFDDDDGDDGDTDDEMPSEWYEMFDGGFLLIMLIIDGNIVLEDDDDADDDGDDGDDGEDGDGPPWDVTVSVDGSGGTVKPEGTKEVPDGASISIQFLPGFRKFC